MKSLINILFCKILIVLQIKLIFGEEAISNFNFQDEQSTKLFFSKQTPSKFLNEHQFKKWPLEKIEIAHISSLNVRCEKNMMKVKINFDRPFYGIVFSKGHYSDPKCVHHSFKSGTQEIIFHILLGQCGMISSSKKSNSFISSSPWFYTENTIVIQHNHQVQELWDEVRKLRCTWFDFYEKPITFKPLEVDLNNAIQVNFLGDHIQCWMKIQHGKGLHTKEALGLVKIGDTLTMTVGIKVEENKFDMIVKNCIAHDGRHKPIQLIDQSGCASKPRIMSSFKKIKMDSPFVSLISYAYFRAFKFPDSIIVYFECVVQVCRHSCPRPVCKNFDDNILSESKVSQNLKQKNLNQSVGDDIFNNFNIPNLNSLFNSTLNESFFQNYTHILNLSPKSKPRFKRSKEPFASTKIDTHKMIKVIAPEDIDFDSIPEINAAYQSEIKSKIYYCISTFISTSVFFIIILFLSLSIIFSISIYFKMKIIVRYVNGKSKQIS